MVSNSNRELPIDHVMRMENTYHNEIVYSINNTLWIREYTKDLILPTRLNNVFGWKTKYKLFEGTTDEGIVYAEQLGLSHGDSVVLNFASSTTPGGGFLTGAMAQEEALCGVSTLYNVLQMFDGSVYSVQRENTNNSLYMQSILYTPKVVFETSIGGLFADVITCAAPNSRAARSKGVNIKTIQNVMFNRIIHILDVATKNSTCNCLILGAFGCGVFGNDPTFVAEMFKLALESQYKGYFKQVIFAIPNKNGVNYKAFKDVWKDTADIV